MDKLVVFNNSDLSRFLNIRPSESKFGEHVKMLPSTCNIYEYIENLDVGYVLIGIPESIGVFANLGQQSTTHIWEATLKVLLNIQKNEFTNPEDVLILGYLNFEKELKKINDLDLSIDKQLVKCRKIVSKIDKEVSNLVYCIKKAGKIPIIIGRGHNNAYGNIKGSALALNSPINVVNLDTLTNFKPEEGRHSGNGFTYAFTEGFLKKYYVFGVHENHIPNSILKTINKLKEVSFSSYESIEVKQNTTFKKELKHAWSFIKELPFGIEIDCSAIEKLNEDTVTTCGFSLKKARRFVNYFGKRKAVQYLHICEATPTEENALQIGKQISYLVTDFIHAHSTKKTLE
ncbi:arginase family protein [uncultured Formosa sp.]|uniref:arginase family protein n=1 Tax=uncultured Formosa sp. TaxID=255435 RepID=UPI002629A89A|nr:arginase family protein [uncultured Formosa sp.]